MTDKPSGLTQIRCQDAGIAFVGAVLVLVVMLILRDVPPIPIFDAVVYIRLGLGLSEFGVFGNFSSSATPPPVDLELGPVYPAFLAALISIDDAMRQGLVCLVESRPDPSGCALHFRTLLIAQALLMAAFLVSVWLTAYIISRSRLVGWVAMFIACASVVPSKYAGLYLTEAVTLPIFGFFTLFSVLAMVRSDQRRWPILAGLCIGLLALTRPTFAYLFAFLICIAVIYFVAVRAHRKAWIALIVFSIAYCATVAPWSIYKSQVETRETGVSYGAVVLSHRLGYNQMSWPEVGVAFIYWLPDFGDSLAKKLFAPRYYEKLGWSERGYYRLGARAVNESTARGSPPTIGNLVRRDILSQPLKHTMVSAALAWRGMFINNYWGILSWIAGAIVLWHAVRNNNRTVLLLFLPACAMVGFHALVSVSIPRYNIILIPALSYAMAVVACNFVGRWRDRSSAQV